MQASQERVQDPRETLHPPAFHDLTESRCDDAVIIQNTPDKSDDSYKSLEEQLNTDRFQTLVHYKTFCPFVETLIRIPGLDAADEDADGIITSLVSAGVNTLQALRYLIIIFIVQLFFVKRNLLTLFSTCGLLQILFTGSSDSSYRS